MALHDADSATDRLERTYVDDGVSHAEAGTIKASE